MVNVGSVRHSRFAPFGFDMAQFDRQIATAQRLIKKNGQQITWRKINDATPADPDAPWNGGTQTVVEKQPFICFVPAKDSSTRIFMAYLAGTEVKTGRLAGLMGAVDFVPDDKDIVVRDGVELRIDSIDKLSPNGQAVLYMIEFKG